MNRYVPLYCWVMLCLWGCVCHRPGHVVPPLGASLQSKDPEVRRLSAKTLGEIGDDRSVGSLIACLTDETESVRLEALKALRRITSRDYGMDYETWVTWYQTNLVTDSEYFILPDQDLKTLPSSMDAHHDTANGSYIEESRIDSYVNQPIICPMESVSSQGRLAVAAQSMTELLALLEDPDPEIRKTGIQSLALRGDLSCVEKMGHILIRDADPEVRARAAGALGILGAPQSKDVLVAALNDPSEQVRFYSVSALRWVGDTSVVWPLILALRDSDARIRTRSYMILKHLTGEELDQDPILWQDWYGHWAGSKMSEVVPSRTEDDLSEEG